ncbi:FtsW/RodA/SpoVE family cell cycle protein [Arsenicicoccus sp. oral taxon 190]|uniref:FtsW/RodA/SpoVE family cell cycle protein n=1 Tax=Arsenicicoccus sp. oral taxon 190 TaxID=1658671 RepID=UPI0009E215BC|nr:putative peptidoglycan glycosyltransferase FtsW [Arsenicicoccus sp. oral taxon 190]
MTTRPGATRAGTVGSGRAGRDTLPDRVSAFLERIDTPLTTHHLLVSVTATLTIFGLVMYLSASSIRSYDNFLKQLVFAGVGAVLCFVASRIPVRVWRRLAWPGIGLALLLQGLIYTPLGVTFQGNRNWIQIAGYQLQPSEFAKIAIVVFGAAILDRKKDKLSDFWHAMVPLVPVAVLLLGLQLAGQDLGTGLVLLAIVAGTLYAAGVSARLFGIAGVLGAVAVAVMTLSSGNRMGRINAWIGDGCTTNPDLCRQVVNGKYALADGGWWGVGLGASTEKWGWLSESRNDFIFAIVGEELGLPGTFAVLFLLAALAYACYRLVFRTDDLFVRLAAAGVMTWLIVQSAINMGAVTGLLPVIGVPLPLVSGGGTALISTLTALGMLMAFAREEPGAREARALRRVRVRPTSDARTDR